MRASAGNEDGFTLVELLVAATLMGVVLVTALTALTSLQRTQRDAGDRTAKLTAGRDALERMTRELRQASKVYASPAPSATTFKVATYVHENGSATATKRDVSYACDATARTCTRSVMDTGGTVLSTTRLRTGQTNTDVFTFTATAPSTTVSYIGIKLALGLQDGASQILTDGVDLRNAT